MGRYKWSHQNNLWRCIGTLCSSSVSFMEGESWRLWNNVWISPLWWMFTISWIGVMKSLLEQDWKAYNSSRYFRMKRALIAYQIKAYSRGCDVFDSAALCTKFYYVVISGILWWIARFLVYFHQQIFGSLLIVCNVKLEGAVYLVFYEEANEKPWAFPNK